MGDRPEPSFPDFYDIGQLQRVGETKIQHLIKYLETQELSEDEKLLELKTKGKNEVDITIKQLWIPERMRSAALQAYHDNFAGGCHLGITRTHRALQHKYFWHSMNQNVHDYISACDVCKRIRRPTN